MDFNKKIAPPTGDVLALITSLSNPVNHEVHTHALKVRDSTLEASPHSYGSTCLQFGRVLACPSPDLISQNDIQTWSNSDGGVSVMQLRHDPVGGWSQLRQMAGLLLKNALTQPPMNKDTKSRMRLLPDAAQELKCILCQSIVDENDAVRRASSSIISSCTVGTGFATMDGMEALPLYEWGETILAPFLVNCLESAISIMEGSTASSATMEDKIKHALLGSLMTLTKLLEDDAAKFERGSGAAFNKIVPCLLKLLKLCGEQRIKTDALKCCVNMIEVMPGSLVAQMSDFLGVLSALGNDPSSQVRQLVCRAIVNLLSERSEYLQEHILSVSQFMLKSTSDTGEGVALEACEFWLTFASLDDHACTPTMTEAVESLFPQLLPTLVKGLVYPPEKIEEILESNAIDEHQGEDRLQDVAPVFHKSKTKGGGKEDNEGAEDDDDDDDDDELDDKEWCLRTCAAASLDGLSRGFSPEKVLPHLLPALQECLSHNDPWVREAGILALGAIADGCGSTLRQHMTQLHPYLMSQVTTNESLPQLKSISFWALGRYVFWAMEQASSGAQPELIRNLIDVVLSRILDKHRKVQVSACSVLGEIIEQTGEFAIPYLENIYRALVYAIDRQQTRALMVTLEIFGSIAEVVGPATGEGVFPTIYVPALLTMWANKAKQNPFDRTLLPLMESLASITMVIGMSYQPWALQTFDGALSIINSCMMILSCGEFTDEEADAIVCATDILDGLVEGLGANFAELVASSSQYGEHFLPVLGALTGHEVDGVRMSTFALFGDIAKHCPMVIQDGMTELLTEAIACIDPLTPSVCNNAVWAVGEVCVKCIGNPASLEAFASDIVEGLIILLVDSAYSGSPAAGLVENAASTMGRLAKVNPAFVAKDLQHFLNGWLDGCSKIYDPLERRDAFEGLMMAIQANPQSLGLTPERLSDTLNVLLFAVVSWHLPSGNMNPAILTSSAYQFVPFPQDHMDLCNNLRTFLHHLKDMAGAEWNEILRNMPVNVRKLFRDVYGFS
mmetsp:Transcript_12774/g.14414  ORF Transcript_12774/g.14414 Transcript_12774/m.14414 type:complete len:1015 (+) Transcript_12774:323-3367(+)